MTSLEISDMYFDKFDVLGQYLVDIWSMFVQQVSVQVYNMSLEFVKLTKLMCECGHFRFEKSCECTGVILTSSME